MTTQNWAIRSATEDDTQALIEFNLAIARETENKELDKSIVSRGVERGLALANDVSYYVAEHAGEPIGCLMTTREWSDWRDGWLAWVQSVYVSPEHRGQGVFRGLLEHVTEELRLKPDVVGIRLYVEEGNARAQAVYARTGFSDPRYKVLELLL